MLGKLLKNYGMILVLVALIMLFSLLTLKEQVPDSDLAAIQLVARVGEGFTQNDRILVVGAEKKSRHFLPNVWMRSCLPWDIRTDI